MRDRVEIAKQELGPRVMDFYATSFERGLAQRDRCDPARFIDVGHDAFVADSIGVAERIYAHFRALTANDRPWLGMHAAYEVYLFERYRELHRFTERLTRDDFAALIKFGIVTAITILYALVAAVVVVPPMLIVWAAYHKWRQETGHAVKVG